ncbi:uncharacterized protein LOC110990124 isoform X1 [Acanthaster planci]|uniref:Uncharacterized protein LOC110990124 isoform X1 n=1 Tax=Acanthaster planci TaxID=133434 RepID=A0A8B7ZZY0_ACAPL|nr:uncharacterized protein LOC110990124 isoform X1 [Acanthaster planci]
MALVLSVGVEVVGHTLQTHHILQVALPVVVDNLEVGNLKVHVQLSLHLKPRLMPNWASAAEAKNRPRDGSDDCTMLAHPTVVPCLSEDADRATFTVTPNGQATDSQVQQQSSSTEKEVDSDSRSHIRKASRESALSERATPIILNAWKCGTHKQYSLYIQIWNAFCLQGQSDSISTSVNEVIDFLTQLFEGLRYSAINTARSALSQFVICKGGVTTGSHPWVIKFIREVYNLRPPVPRHHDTWDASVLLKYLRLLSPVAKLTLKMLTLKTVTLASLLVAARAQTLNVLDLTNMTKKHPNSPFW